MARKVLVYDTEGNSLDTDQGTVQELAWAIYDADTKRLLSAKSHLLQWNTHYVVEPGAFAATGLTREFCEEYGRPSRFVFEEFLVDCERVDFIAGHNIIGYDNLIMASNIRRALFGEPVQMQNRISIDSYHDCPYPASIKQFGLKYLALDHGHVMSNAHQALADVFACAHVLFSYPFNECLAIASTPLVTLAAHTDFHDLEARERCYQAKFRWNRENRRWEKRVRGYFVPGIQLQLNLDLLVNEEPVPLKREVVPMDEQCELPF